MLAAMLRPTCSRVASACSAPARRSNSGQSTSSSTGSRPNHPATPAARPRSVIACSDTTWKLDPIAAGGGGGGPQARARAARGGAGERALEGLRDVVGVDVVQHAEPQPGQGERLAGGQAPPDVEVEVARR